MLMYCCDRYPYRYQTISLRKALKKCLLKSLKLQKNRHKDSYQPGIRLIAVNKNDVETNPLPSLYLH